MCNFYFQPSKSSVNNVLSKLYFENGTVPLAHLSYFIITYIAKRWQIILSTVCLEIPISQIRKSVDIFSIFKVTAGSIYPYCSHSNCPESSSPVLKNHFFTASVFPDSLLTVLLAPCHLVSKLMLWILGLCYSITNFCTSYLFLCTLYNKPFLYIKLVNAMLWYHVETQSWFMKIQNLP